MTLISKNGLGKVDQIRHAKVIMLFSHVSYASQRHCGHDVGGKLNDGGDGHDVNVEVVVKPHARYDVKVGEQYCNGQTLNNSLAHGCQVVV